MNKKTCAECKYFDAYQAYSVFENRGECRRYPPKIIYDGTEMTIDCDSHIYYHSRNPHVDAHMRACGEFQPVTNEA